MRGCNQPVDRIRETTTGAFVPYCRFHETVAQALFVKKPSTC